MTEEREPKPSGAGIEFRHVFSKRGKTFGFYAFFDRQELCSERIDLARPRSIDKFVEKLRAACKAHPELCELTEQDEAQVRSEIHQVTEDQSSRPAVTEYAYTDNGIIRVDPMGGDEPLSNFNAVILRTIVEDYLADSVEKTLEVGVWLDSESPPGQFEPGVLERIPAKEFMKMEWPIPRFGPRLVVKAGYGTKDKLREGIQRLSLDRGIHDEVVFRATGWTRKIGGQWSFLSASGALGKDGLMDDGVAVKLPEGLDRIRLAPPPTPLRLRRVVRCVVLRLLTAGPYHLTVPFLCLPFRAPLGGVDVSGQFTAHSGHYKTSLAVMLQQFYGKDFTEDNLPNFTSTANANESLAFLAKDCLLVFDDFVPGEYGRRATEAKVQRLIRGTANQAARRRSNPDGSLSDRAFHPRCLPLITGEEGHGVASIMARLWEVEYDKQDLSSGVLVKLYRHGERGRLAETMSGFVQWLCRTGRIEGLMSPTTSFRQLARKKQFALDIDVDHDRTRRNLAEFLLTLDCVLDFAEDVSALSPRERKQVQEDAEKALVTQVGKQAEAVREASAGITFLQLFQQALRSGTCHLTLQDGGHPHDAAQYGYRAGYQGDLVAAGPCAGFVEPEDDCVYLLPDVALKAAKDLSTGSGTKLDFGSKAVFSQLKEQGIVEPEPRTDRPGQFRLFHRRRMKGGGQVSVAKIQLAALPLDDQEDGGDGPPF